ncbi:hypothetical protein [Cellulomonas xylanilytica]|uniref:Uncharacterized protein n=1 Tax=Cellulomonas xylanilytica TaxID=233583 RepID=A0A510V9N3_9CELL|nr:hypothetical protein [Cellulomonas xylanilytica]GEK23456.1 hypothetical protein CXY01_39760 [Cellulomonas xylanilytica]
MDDKKQPDPPGAQGTGPDENELDPAKTGADASQDDERSDAG